MFVLNNQRAMRGVAIGPTTLWQRRCRFSESNKTRLRRHKPSWLQHNNTPRLAAVTDQSQNNGFILHCTNSNANTDGAHIGIIVNHNNNKPHYQCTCADCLYESWHTNDMTQKSTLLFISQRCNSKRDGVQCSRGWPNGQTWPNTEPICSAKWPNIGQTQSLQMGSQASWGQERKSKTADLTLGFRGAMLERRAGAQQTETQRHPTTTATKTQTSDCKPRYPNVTLTQQHNIIIPWHTTRRLRQMPAKGNLCCSLSDLPST